jgi:hypothetical protein
MDQEIKLIAQYQGEYRDIYFNSQTLTARTMEEVIPIHRLTGFQDFLTCRNAATLENCWYKLNSSSQGLVLVKSPCLRGGVHFAGLNEEQTEIAVKEKLLGKNSSQIGQQLGLDARLIDDALAGWNEFYDAKRTAGEQRLCMCGLKSPELVCVCEQKITLLCQVCCDVHIRLSSLPIHPFEPISMLNAIDPADGSAILKFLRRKEKIDCLHFGALKLIHRIKLFKAQVDRIAISPEEKAVLYGKAEFIKSKYQKIVDELDEIRYSRRNDISSNANELLLAIKRKRPDTVSKELEISLRLRVHSAPNKISNVPSASISYNLSDFSKILYSIDTSGNLWDCEAFSMVKRSHPLPEDLKGFNIPPSCCTLPSEFAFFSGGQKYGAIPSAGIINLNKLNVRKVADMHVPRYDHTLVYFEGDIYAFGGNDGSRILTSVEVYSLKTNTWRLISDMPSPRTKFAPCIVNDEIWLAGGIGTTSIDIYNTTDATYRMLNNPPVLEDASTLISNIGDKLIIIQAGTVHYYYPDTEITEVAGNINDSTPVTSSRAMVHSGRLLWMNMENKFQILKLNGSPETSLSSS